MAKISLTLCNIACCGLGDLRHETIADIALSSDGKLNEVWLGQDIHTCEKYRMSLVNIDFLKKMYQPTEVNVDILLDMTEGSEWIPFSKSELETSFKNVQVKLECDDKTIGDDYYVHEVQVIYNPSSMHVKLKICSLDKLLTLRQASRAFVAKKLGADIIKDELKKYIKPWTVTKEFRDTFDNIYKKVNSLSDSDRKEFDGYVLNIMSKISSGSSLIVTNYPEKFKEIINLINECIAEKAKQESVSYGIDQMRVLKNGTTEHIHPYLVQYNESFLDFLARTANRWGEFLYYEDGALNVGYNKSNTPTKVTGYTDRYYFNIYDASNKKDLSMSVSKEGSYDILASNEEQFTKNELDKSPNKLKLKADKMVMKTISNFFKNDKSIFTFLVNEGVDIALDVAGKAATNTILNNQFNSDYFPDSDTIHQPEQRNSGKDKFNQFTEIDTKYDDAKYSGIFENEQKTGENALHINFDTTYPNLKLGQMITVDKENYIVVEVSCKKLSSVDYALEEKTGTNEKGYKLNKTTTSKYVFEVVALADLSNDATKVFYPAVIPSGHIRQAEPQMATIVNADDPSGKNQVRVKFPWQKDTVGDASPWLKFTTNAQGSASIGKHYSGDKVLVGFINGNVERPYVMGGLAQEGDGADIIHTTPGGHTLKINDDPAGVTKFMTGMFFPGWKTLSSFLPQMNQIETDKDADPKLGGGFELSDNYGIYKISGSSDGRNVSVASPWGDVKINAFTGITISAPNGDVRITGKNVSIEAGNNLTLTSGSNVKKRLLADSATETWSNIGGNVAAAVAKKLLDTILNLVTIDLTIIRNVFDIVFRPIEGKLEIKSNRYLMLESGKGECVYPESAFKNDDQKKKAILKRSQDDCRPGLNLASEVDTIAKKIDNMGDMIVNDWVNTYNKCVRAKGQFEETVKIAARWANDHDGRNIPVICKTYEELKNDLWADSNDLLTDEDKLGFESDGRVNFKVSDNNDVKNPLLHNYMVTDPLLDESDPTDVEMAKTEICQTRTMLRKEVFDAANDLRKNIIAFKKCCNGLSEDEIKAEIATIKGMTVPDDFKKALIPAFKKENLGDTDFYAEIPEFWKELGTTISANDIETDRKALKRKATVLWLENMGFKDEWRKAVPNRDASGVPVATQDANGNPLPNTTSIPARVFNYIDIIDDIKWEDYLNSLTAVPKLSPVKWKVLDELRKSANSYVDKLYFWKNMEENRSWNTRSGGILFSTDENTYKYKGNDADKEITIAKEKLSEIDDRKGVPSFLNQVRKSLKDIK